MKTKLLIGALCVLISLGANTVSASVSLADTGGYDSTNGKSLLLYGTAIKNVTIRWYNAYNETQYKQKTFSNLNDNSYLFRIKSNETFNSTLVLYQIGVLDVLGGFWTFEGGFSTVLVKPEKINYSQIRNITKEYYNTLTLFLIGNSSYKNLFTNVQNKVSEFNQGLVQSLRDQGLSDSQIEEVQTAISDGFATTLRSQEAQDKAVKDAESKGFNYAIQLVIIFLVIVIIVGVVWFVTKGRVSFRRKGKREVESFSFDNVFGES